jgi:hypothetical protein
LKVINFSQQGHKKKFEKAMKLAELGFYKKKNRFEGAQDVLDFYNKTVGSQTRGRAKRDPGS